MDVAPRAAVADPAALDRLLREVAWGADEALGHVRIAYGTGEGAAPAERRVAAHVARERCREVVRRALELQDVMRL